MKLEVLTPEKSLFSGEIEAVTVPGISGRFQILKNHAPIVSALTDGEVIIRTTDGEERFMIDRGFVEVLRNEISLLVHTPAEEEQKPD